VAAVTTRLDYYALLGVEPDATAAQIKKAYRTLARQHHPDTNPGDPQAAARFRNITEAYDTLSDPKRREAYDRTRPPVTGTKLTESAADIRTASLLVQVLEETWLAIRRRHSQSRPWSSSWPAAPKPASPAGATSPPPAGTSKPANAPKS
jgi:curved DNA-binding protein CbpA